MGTGYIFPGCSVIGWIPYTNWPSRWPPCCHELLQRAPDDKTRVLRWAGFWGLFLSGNAVPPFSYPSFRHLERRLRRHQHRAAVGLNDISLTPADGVWEPRSQSVTRRNIGITRPPFRMYLPLQSKWLRGRGEVGDVRVRCSPSGAVLSQQVDFRLSRMVDAASYRLMGHYAPRAWIKMAYHMREDGRGTVVIRGSFVPTRTTYGGLTRKSEQRMHQLSADEFWEFISCGTNVRAPGRRRVCLPGQNHLSSLCRTTTAQTRVMCRPHPSHGFVLRIRSPK